MCSIFPGFGRADGVIDPGIGNLTSFTTIHRIMARAGNAILLLMMTNYPGARDLNPLLESSSYRANKRKTALTVKSKSDQRFELHDLDHLIPLDVITSSKQPRRLKYQGGKSRGLAAEY